MPLTSQDVLTERVEALRELFPEAFAEGVIDFAKLKQALGEFTDDSPERYGLSWAGKSEAIRAIQSLSSGTLVPCKEESVNFDTTGNLIIEGDNLEVLKLLQKSYYGKVKMIYIDPPYNTGKDFIYPDNYREGLDGYLRYSGQIDDEGLKLETNTETSGRFHSRWLNMMYPRLFLAKNLLSDDGLIAVSIDHNEVTNLRSLLLELFGEENAVNTLTWVNNLKGRQISTHGAALTHEFVVVFARNSDVVEQFSVSVDWAKLNMPNAYKGFDYEVLSDTKGNYVLKNQLYNTNSAFNESTRPNLVFNIHWNPTTGEVRTTDVEDSRTFEGFRVIRPHPCEDGRHKYHAWRWSRNKVEQEKEDLAFVSTGEYVRVFTKVRGHATTVLKDLVTDISTNKGAKDVEDLLGSCHLTYPKPVSLVQLLVQAMTTSDEEAVVMDFFAGSGTTAQAVLDMNKCDGGGNRRFILVQLPEPTGNKDLPTIADICKERVRCFIKKLNEESSAKLDMDKENEQDRGFKVFKLTSSNFKLWNADEAPKDAEALAEQLKLYADHIMPGRSQDDILYELLLKAGFSLAAHVEQRTVAGQKVFSVADGLLLICLEDEITQETLRGMIELKPEMALCLDNAFKGNDQLKTNIVLEMESHEIKFHTV